MCSRYISRVKRKCVPASPSPRPPFDLDAPERECDRSLLFPPGLLRSRCGIRVGRPISGGDYYVKESVPLELGLA